MMTLGFFARFAMNVEFGPLTYQMKLDTNQIVHIKIVREDLKFLLTYTRMLNLLIGNKIIC